MNETLQALTGDADAFMREHWGRAPMHRRAGLSPLISEQEILQTVDCGLLSWPYFSLAGSDGRAPDRQVVTRRVLNTSLVGFVNRASVLAGLRQGATLQLGQLEDWHPSIGSLVRELSPVFAGQTRAFAVLSPRPAGDTQPADGASLSEAGSHQFVLQMSGESVWTLAGTAPAPAEQVFLLPGDALYIPHGWPCRAAASGSGGASLHVTITVTEPTASDVAAALARQLRARLDASDRYQRHHLMTVADRVEWVRQEIAACCADTDPQTLMSAVGQPTAAS